MLNRNTIVGPMGISNMNRAQDKKKLGLGLFFVVGTLLPPVWGWTWVLTAWNISAWRLMFDGDLHPPCKQAQLKTERGREKQSKRENV